MDWARRTARYRVSRSDRLTDEGLRSSFRPEKERDYTCNIREQNHYLMLHLCDYSKRIIACDKQKLQAY